MCKGVHVPWSKVGLYFHIGIWLSIHWSHSLPIIFAPPPGLVKLWLTEMLSGLEHFAP